MTKYDALSYVWGSIHNSVTITCDGHDLDITLNLHDALQQLREDGLDGFLWVDAVCIDQGNLDERAKQVRMMRQIYNHAEMVYIWLGRESSNAAAGIELLHRTAHAIRSKYLIDNFKQLTPQHEIHSHRTILILSSCIRSPRRSQDPFSTSCGHGTASHLRLELGVAGGDHLQRMVLTGLGDTGDDCGSSALIPMWKA